MSEIFKIQKNGNYTAMSNIHLQDKRLSLKSKGLLSLMLSLPADRWKYSIRGLASICRDGVDSVRDGIRELERAGYVIRFRARKANGQLSEAIYWIYEEPQTAPRNGDESEDNGGTVTSFDIPPEEEVAGETASIGKSHIRKACVGWANVGHSSVGFSYNGETNVGKANAGKSNAGGLFPGKANVGKHHTIK